VTSTPVLEVDRLSRIYDSPAGPVHALREVSFRVWSGQLVSVIGPSGSGKSTLLNVLGLLDRPTSGRYLLNGRDTAELPEKERTALRARSIGFVFQSFHLISHKTSAGNVAVTLMYTGLPRKQRRARAVEALERFGLGHRTHAFPTTLSGGERQRVAIARATVHEPILLLCDEPTGNLDSETSATVMALLRELASEHHLAVVVVTHDPAVAQATDRILRVKDGRLTEVTADV